MRFHPVTEPPALEIEAREATLFQSKPQNLIDRTKAIPLKKLPEPFRTKGVRYWLKDGEGYLYAVGGARRTKPIHLAEGLDINGDIIVLKYSPGGEFLARIEYPDTPVSGYTYDAARIDSAGNIYCLQYHEKSLDVVKYELKITPMGLLP